MTLTRQQAATQIQAALTHARRGSATLKELVSAHELAEQAQGHGHEMAGTLAELREHIRRAVPGPSGSTERKSVVLGVIAGLISGASIQLLFRFFDRRQRA